MADVPSRLTDEGQIWCVTADPRSALTRQISSECVDCLGFRWPKRKFWANFDIWGSAVPTQISPMKAKLGVLEQTRGACLPVKLCVDQFILSPPGGKKPQIFLLFGIRHFEMSAVGSNLRKLIMGAQLQTFPYPTISKSFLYSNAFMAKSGVQSLTFKSMMNRQISTFLAVPAAGKILYLENLWGSGA